MSMERASLNDVLTLLAERAGESDATAAWPDASWVALRRGGVPRWCIPPAYEGDGLGGIELLARYELLAGACLTTCFILSQRDAACRRLLDSGKEELCRELLPALARGDSFTTVGLSQLTTSRQHVRPALTAREERDAFILDGTIPWVTGAGRADHLVIGAVVEPVRQILAVLPCRLPGVSIGPPLELTALEGSITAEVRCANVVLDRKWLLAGPVEKVMALGRGGAGGLDTSCLALGLAGSAVAYLRQEARSSRPELEPIALRLERTHQSLRAELHRLAETGRPATPDAASAPAALRARANSLVLRATQAALTASKGAGFLRNHPAQRWARQALFFLVWSCPRPAAEAFLASLVENADCGW